MLSSDTPGGFEQSRFGMNLGISRKDGGKGCAIGAGDLPVRIRRNSALIGQIETHLKQWGAMNIAHRGSDLITSGPQPVGHVDVESAFPVLTAFKVEGHDFSVDFQFKRPQGPPLKSRSLRRFGRAKASCEGEGRRGCRENSNEIRRRPDGRRDPFGFTALCHEGNFVVVERRASNCETSHQQKDDPAGPLKFSEDRGPGRCGVHSVSVGREVGHGAEAGRR